MLALSACLFRVLGLAHVQRNFGLPFKGLPIAIVHKPSQQVKERSTSQITGYSKFSRTELSRRRK